jgi:hypothetical protein
MRGIFKLGWHAHHRVSVGARPVLRLGCRRSQSRCDPTQPTQVCVDPPSRALSFAKRVPRPKYINWRAASAFRSIAVQPPITPVVPLLTQVHAQIAAHAPCCALDGGHRRICPWFFLPDLSDLKRRSLPAKRTMRRSVPQNFAYAAKFAS